MTDQRSWAPLTGLRPYRAVRVPVVDRVMTWVAEQFPLTVPGLDDVHGTRDRGDSLEQGLGALRDSGRAVTCPLPRGRGVVSVPVDRQALPPGAR